MSRQDRKVIKSVRHLAYTDMGIFKICNYMRFSVLTSLTSAYIQRKRKSRKGGAHSTLSLLRKELREGNLQSLFGGSSCIVSSSNAAPDPLLSSFILPMTDDSSSLQSHLSTAASSAKKSSVEKLPERYAHFYAFLNLGLLSLSLLE